MKKESNVVLVSHTGFRFQYDRNEKAFVDGDISFDIITALMLVEENYGDIIFYE